MQSTHSSIDVSDIPREPHPTYSPRNAESNTRDHFGEWIRSPPDYTSRPPSITSLPPYSASISITSYSQRLITLTPTPIVDEDLESQYSGPIGPASLSQPGFNEERQTQRLALSLPFRWPSVVRFKAWYNCLSMGEQVVVFMAVSWIVCFVLGASLAMGLYFTKLL
jgi:hypothetical protein